MTKKYDFSGVWRSVHHKVDSRGGAEEVDHYVTLQLIGDQLIIGSIPDSTGTSMMARFTFDGKVATGNYQSQDFPGTPDGGSFYHGAAMLVLDPDGKAFRGKGVGFGKDLSVKTTAWDIIRVEQDGQILEPRRP